jgi:hypothetical protein
MRGVPHFCGARRTLRLIEGGRAQGILNRNVSGLDPGGNAMTAFVLSMRTRTRCSSIAPLSAAACAL